MCNRSCVGCVQTDPMRGSQRGWWTKDEADRDREETEGQGVKRSGSGGSRSGADGSRSGVEGADTLETAK